MSENVLANLLPEGAGMHTTQVRVRRNDPITVDIVDFVDKYDASVPRVVTALAVAAAAGWKVAGFSEEDFLKICRAAYMVSPGPEEMP